MATRTELETEVKSLRAENALLTVTLKGFRKKKEILLAKVEEMISTLEGNQVKFPRIEELKDIIREPDGEKLAEKSIKNRKEVTPF